MDKQPDLVIPWALAVNLLRSQLIASLLRKGHSLVESTEIIQAAAGGVATAEMVELTQSLLDQAGVEYTRRPDKPGMGTRVNAILDLKKP